MSNAEARKQLANSSALLQKKYEALKTLLANSALAKEYCLAQSFLHGENWGESAALREREQFNKTMIEQGYRWPKHFGSAVFDYAVFRCQERTELGILSSSFSSTPEQ